MQPTELTAGRQVAARADEARPDLLVHALAQTADDVRLCLHGDGGRGGLERLARAYAIGDRLSFEATHPADPGVVPRATMAELVESLGRPDDAPSAPERDDGALSGERVAIFTNVPAPYRIPLFNTMARRLSAVGGELRVFFQSMGSSSRPWIGSGGEMDFGHELLRSVELPMGFRRPRVSMAPGRPLRSFEPTIVLCGSLSPLVAPRVASAARRAGAVFGIWSGEVAWRPTAAGAHRRLMRQRILARADFGVAYGQQAAEYLRDLRADLPVTYGRNSSAAYAVGRDRPARPDVVELLTVADMAVPGKNVGLLIDAVRDRPGLACRLTIVGGGGAARDAIEQRAHGDERIRFLGAMPQARVRECYAASDVYLFPSQIDVFGLALVEAMGSGLAPVTATRPGVASDLAVHERNCLAVDTYDRAAWADSIERIVLDHQLRTALGEAAKATIGRRWTIDHACEGMFAGLRLGLLAAGKAR